MSADDWIRENVLIEILGIQSCPFWRQGSIPSPLGRPLLQISPCRAVQGAIRECFRMKEVNMSERSAPSSHLGAAS